MTMDDFRERLEALEQQGNGPGLMRLSQDIRSCCWSASARQAAYDLAGRADRAAAALGCAPPLPKHGSVGTSADGQSKYGGRY